MFCDAFLVGESGRHFFYEKRDSIRITAAPILPLTLLHAPRQCPGMQVWVVSSCATFKCRLQCRRLCRTDPLRRRQLPTMPRLNSAAPGRPHRRSRRSRRHRRPPLDPPPMLTSQTWTPPRCSPPYLPAFLRADACAGQHCRGGLCCILPYWNWPGKVSHTLKGVNVPDGSVLGSGGECSGPGVQCNPALHRFMLDATPLSGSYRTNQSK